MKEQILRIADKLRNDEITDKEAEKLLLCLFGVSGSSLKIDELNRLIEKEMFKNMFHID